MSDEFQYCHNNSTDILYATLRNPAQQIRNVVTPGWDSYPGSGSLDNYDISAAAPVGELWSGDMPSGVANGFYIVQIRKRVGGTPDCSDPIQAADKGYWNGTVFNTLNLDASGQVGLKDDAITSSKFDETTAFSIKSDDSGATQIGRTGADGDTLETLSDQMDPLATESNVDDNENKLDSLITSLAAVLADTNELQGLIASSKIAAQVKGMDADVITASALNTDAVNEIWAKAMVDLAAGAPSATASVHQAINYLFEAWRNTVKTNKDDGEMAVFKDDGVTKLCEASVSDDGTTFTKGEFGAVD